MKYEKVIRDMVQKCADEAVKRTQRRSAEGRPVPMYLYYKEPTLKEHGNLVLIDKDDSAEPGYELATLDPLRLDVPYLNYFCWVKARVGRLPLLCDNLLRSV